MKKSKTRKQKNQRNQRRQTIALLIVLALIGSILTGSAMAVTKIPKSLNFMSVFGGMSSPVGTVEGVPGELFSYNGTIYEIDALNAYDDAVFFGFDYGQVYFRHLSLSVGFSYIGHKYLNPSSPVAWPGWVNSPKLNQYDFTVKSHYLLNDLRTNRWSPYVGLSLLSGFTTVDWGDIENENRLTLALGLDFGAEAKVYRFSHSKGFITLASVNNYNFMTTGDRPQYLHFGGAIKYYYMD